MTEAVPIATNPKAALRPGAMGLPSQGFELRILDLQGRDLLRVRSARSTYAAPLTALGIGTTPKLPELRCRTAGCIPATSPSAT